MSWTASGCYGEEIVFTGTRAEERVVLMQDIIKQLDVEEIVAELGIYLGVENNEQELTTGKVDAQSALSSLGPCRVCQRGAIVRAMVMRHDRLQIERDLYVSDLLSNVASVDDHPYLRQLFPLQMLKAMERAFEGWETDDERLAENPWANTNFGPARQMRAICENVIRNNGEFVMQDVQRPLTKAPRRRRA